MKRIIFLGWLLSMLTCGNSFATETAGSAVLKVTVTDGFLADLGRINPRSAEISKTADSTNSQTIQQFSQATKFETTKTVIVITVTNI